MKKFLFGLLSLTLFAALVMFWPSHPAYQAAVIPHPLRLPKPKVVPAPTLLELTNRTRLQYHRPTLVETSDLDTSARNKCLDMETHNYWAHGNWLSFMPYYPWRGENLARGFMSDQGTFSGWMASPGHRANILNWHYTHVGFAHCDGFQHNLVVEHLGG